MKTIVKLLILSDFFIFTGLGLISPIIAIFIKENLVGGSIHAAGIASMIFIFIRSILQPVFAYIAQPKHRLSMLIGGTSLILLVPIIYFFSSNVIHFYIASIIYGIGAAIAYPPWLSYFTRNLTKGAEGFEWSVYYSVEGVGSAIAALIGGYAVEKIGFYSVFIIVAIMLFFGLLVVLWIGMQNKNHKIKIK
ncbi:MAG: MFS transporter [Candidatus Pacearchaeota archaeon]